MFTVVVTEKGGSKQTLEFDEEIVTIGRVQGNQVILPRGNVSKQHAKLELKGQDLWITDLGSTNGTYINGRRITEATAVKSADSVYIGEFILTLEMSGEVPVSDTPQDLAPAPPKPRLPTPKPPRARAPRPPVRTSKRPVPASSIPAGATVPMSVEEAEQIEEEKEPSEDTPPVSRESKGSDQVVGQILDVLSRQIKRIDRAALPMRLDEGTAGQVRISMGDLVDEQVSLGRISSAERGAIMGKAFRATVDLGPLGDWLEDDQVQEARIEGPFNISLLKGGVWSDAVRGFSGEDSLMQALKCLGAGVTGRDEGGVSGLVRYRMEDGPVVLATFPPAADSGTFATIYKNLTPRICDGGGRGNLGEGVARDSVAKSVEAGARIAVVGSRMPYRMSVLSDICALVPSEGRLVGVEDIPLVGFKGSNMLGMAAHGYKKAESRQPGVGSLLARAMDLGADWLAIVGTWWDDLPAVVACSAGRKGVVADLPLDGGVDLDVELAAAFTAAGSPLGPEGAARLFTGAFDIVVKAERGPDGYPAIARIMRTGMLGDEWAPKTIYEKG